MYNSPQIFFLIFDKFCLTSRIFLVSVLLSVSVKRCFVSCMRDFFLMCRKIYMNICFESTKWLQSLHGGVNKKKYFGKAAQITRNKLLLFIFKKMSWLISLSLTSCCASFIYRSLHLVTQSGPNRLRKDPGPARQYWTSYMQLLKIEQFEFLALTYDADW